MPNGTLEVIVAAGRRLKDEDTFGKNDAYVEVYVDKKYKQRTTTISNSNDPVWNERFTFNIHHGDDSIHFDVYDADIADKDSIGNCKVKLKHVFDDGKFDEWVKLPTMFGLSSHGEIHVIMNFRISTKIDKNKVFYLKYILKFSGLTDLFISCVLSATLSTFSSGVNSIATVILEDICKRLSSKNLMSNERQVILSKVLSVIIGCLTVFLAFVVSYMKSNIITMVLQIFGAFTGPMLGVYLLGLFTSRVKSQSTLVAFFLSLIFQMFLLNGSMFTIKPANKQGGRLPTSVVGCPSSVNVTLPSITNQSSNVLISLFSISPLWFVFIGASITVIFGLIFSKQ